MALRVREFGPLCADWECRASSLIYLASLLIRCRFPCRAQEEAKDGEEGEGEKKKQPVVKTFGGGAPASKKKKSKKKKKK